MVPIIQLILIIYISREDKIPSVVE